MEYKISIRELNQRGFAYLKEIFEDFEGEDFDYLYAYLSYLDDAKITFCRYGDINEFSSTIIRVMNDVNEDYNNLTLNYEEDIKPEKTIIMDIGILNKKGHDYLKKLFGFPDYYGKNLDALYDCLSDLQDMEIIITNMKEVNRKSLKILSVFDDVADEYNNLLIRYENEENE